MGVLDKPKHRAVTIREADVSSEVSDDVLSIPDSEISDAHSVAPDEVLRHRHRRRVRSRRGNPGIGSAADVGTGLSTKRRCGKRAKHRGDNLNYLMNLVGMVGEGGEESELPCTTDSRLIEEAISVFAMILDDQELMALWEDFISRSEEEQREILARGRKIEKSQSPMKKQIMQPIPEETEEGFIEISASRPCRPAQTAKEAFEGINSHLRNLLLRRHFPIGILAQLEDEVVSFFQDFPDAVYVSQPLASLDRLLIHALSQYHSLKAESFNGTGGSKERRTKVENEYRDFVKPGDKTLVQVIENKHSF